jgi:hypothetical protein
MRLCYSIHLLAVFAAETGTFTGAVSLAKRFHLSCDIPVQTDHLLPIHRWLTYFCIIQTYSSALLVSMQAHHLMLEPSGNCIGE